MRKIILAYIIGGLTMPFVTAAIFNTFLPTPLKNTAVAFNNFYNDVALGLKCSIREAKR